MNKREIGSDKEALAEEYLKRHGVRIVEKNYRTDRGEIDLVGYHDGYLVFVEVKYRSGTAAGTAAEAVDRRKQLRICRVAEHYRYAHGIGENVGVRYDVVAIQGERIEWFPNAFSHIGGQRRKYVSYRA